MSRIEDYNKTLPVIEVYTAVQGEGKRAGMPTVVVRTTGCTHRCHVDVPGRAHTNVYLSNGKTKNIKDIEVGDELLAWSHIK